MADQKPFVLACPPIFELCGAELADVCEVVTLTFDGKIIQHSALHEAEFRDDALPFFEAAFITPDAFGLIYEGKRDQLVALYHRLAVLVSAGRVGYVHLPAAGVDVPLFHSLVRACISKQVLLSHCPGVYAKPMAQYCLAYILQILRRVPEHAHNQSTKTYKSLEARDARGITIGVLGAGGIGTEVGKLGKAFGSRTIGWRRQIAHDPAAFDEQRTGVDGLHSILREADFVIVAVPHTPATRRLLSAAELAMMKPTAWLINVSRGPVVDEAALAAALAAPAPTTPAGAVLDVYEVEPLPAASPLWELPAERCILTSHDSWRTEQAFADNRQFFVDNLRRRLAGEEVHGRLAADSELVRPALEAGGGS